MCKSHDDLVELWGPGRGQGNKIAVQDEKTGEKATNWWIPGQIW